MGSLRERQGIGVRWDRYAGRFHLDVVRAAGVDVVLLQDAGQHDEAEAPDQVLTDAGSLADAERQEVRDVLLDAQDLRLVCVGGVDVVVFDYAAEVFAGRWGADEVRSNLR